MANPAAAVAAPEATTATGTTKARLDHNRALRVRYLVVADELAAAKAGRDSFIERRAQRELDGIGREFVARNHGLAVALAKSFIPSGGSNGDDYVQAALWGLWEAFLKWNPDEATFGTFSRNFIAGRLRREVRSAEFSSISYADFTARTKVLDAVRALTAETGREPTDAEVAAHCGATITLVERVRRPQSTSLDAAVGDGDTTLGDIVNTDIDADEIDGADVDLLWDDHLRAITADMTPRELFVFLRRTEGCDGGATQTLVELSNLTGLGREMLRRVEVSARKKADAAAEQRSAALRQRLAAAAATVD